MFVPLYSDEATVGYGHTCKTSTVKLFRLLDASGQFIILLQAISIISIAISIILNCTLSYFRATYVKCVNNNEMILGIHMHMLINLILNMSRAAANVADKQLFNTFFH